MHSIIVTIHNGARRLPNGEILLEKVLDGIVNNTVGDYELLCMLDGCTDDSDKVVSKYEKARACLLYTSPSPRDPKSSRMPSSA